MMEPDTPGGEGTVTVFACVKLRAKGKSSCCAAGSREVLTALQTLAAQPAFAGIRVRPSRCLDNCKKGPAVVVVQHESPRDDASNSNPFASKKRWKKIWKKADARFKRVSPDQAAEVLDAARLLLTTQLRLPPA